MSIFGPTPSAEHFARIDAALFGCQPRPAPQTKYKPITIGDFVKPPEMSDAVKAEGLNGKTCFYGFEFPDSAVAAYDQSRRIQCPEGRELRSWIQQRKLTIMQDVAREYGLTLSARIAMVSSSGACREDVVYFARMANRKLFALMCPPLERIVQLKQAMCVESELRWIVS